MKKFNLPNSDVQVSLADDFDASKVSKFLDDVIGEKASTEAMGDNLDTILGDLGINIDGNGIEELKKSDFVRSMAKEKSGDAEFTPVHVAAGVAATVVVACSDGPAE